MSVTDETLLDAAIPDEIKVRYVAGALGLVFLLLLPLFVERITIIRMTTALYIGMFAMSWDSVSGYTGELSFGHSFFFAIGGYTSAVLNLEYGFHPGITIAAGVLLAVVGGLMIGVPSLRVKGPYFALVTLVAPLLLFQFFTMFSDVFGGETGLRTPERIFAGASGMERTLYNYYFTFGLFVAILGGLWAVTRSNAGAIFYAIRSGEDVVESTGKNVAKFKIFAFVVSAAVGGLAGAAFVHTVGGPTPSELLVLEISLLVIIASVLGGMGTIVGAAIGGMLLHMIEVSVFNQIGLEMPLVGASVDEMSFMLVAVVGILIIYLLPGGILRAAIDAGDYVLERGGGG